MSRGPSAYTCTATLVLANGLVLERDLGSLNGERSCCRRPSAASRGTTTMLVMGSKTVTVDGVTVFADHADKRQFWYLPAPVTLAERAGVPQFTLIRYRPAVAKAACRAAASS